MAVIDRGDTLPLDEDAAVPNAVSELFMLGGDDYSFADGGGGFLNDVWKTLGGRWRVYRNPIQRNKRGEQLVKVVSRLQWTPSSGSLPPDGTSYASWTACLVVDRALALGQAWAPSVPCTADLRDRYDRFAWQQSARWSPRRHLAAASLDGYVYVFGGLARGLEDVPAGWETVHAGFERRVIWREEARLKNDVWRSRDGVTWELMNPGSEMDNSLDLLGRGREDHGCSATDTSNCTLSSACTEALGACTGTLWSPRERHTAASYGSSLYIAGGYISKTTGFCGDRACTIGYRTAVNDVWRSSDTGVTWTVVSAQAPWAARGEHGLVVVGALMYLYGGRGADTRLKAVEPAYNDVWTYAFATGAWTQVTAAAPWSPRSAFGFAAVNETLFVIGGQTQTKELLDEVWHSSDGGITWTEDYSDGTDADQYASPTSRVHYLQSLTASEEAVLAAQGILTVQQLASLDFYEVLALRDGPLPRICTHHARAQALVTKCAVEPEWKDGEGAYETEIVRIGRQRPEDEDVNASLIPAEEIRDPCLPEPDPLKETTWLTTTQEAVNYGVLNLTCRSVFSPRRFPIAGALGPHLYLLGGLAANNTPRLDSWYRDDNEPGVVITTAPEDNSANLVFGVDTDEAGTVFESQLSYDDGTSEQVVYSWARNPGWVVLRPEDELTKTGTYIMELRALDPAGNVNKVPARYRWWYRPDLPVLLIVLLSLLFVALVVLVVLEVRRRRKKRAMERYAIRRMRRKFKGIQKDSAKKSVDWRKYYDESKATAEENLEDKRRTKKKKKKKKGKKKKKTREAKPKRA